MRGAEVNLESSLEEKRGRLCAGRDGVVEGKNRVPFDAGGCLKV
jgi:hypothetical protein